ncbi:MAG: hypothetical protein ACYCPP_08825 [Nitrososphaerales archaeon]
MFDYSLGEKWQLAGTSNLNLAASFGNTLSETHGGIGSFSPIRATEWLGSTNVNYSLIMNPA